MNHHEHDERRQPSGDDEGQRYAEPAHRRQAERALREHDRRAGIDDEGKGREQIQDARQPESGKNAAHQTERDQVRGLGPTHDVETALGIGDHIGGKRECGEQQMGVAEPDEGEQR
jgi:hypothetical protein